MRSADNYETFEKEFVKVINNHVPLKKNLVKNKSCSLQDKGTA